MISSCYFTFAMFLILCNIYFLSIQIVFSKNNFYTFAYINGKIEHCFFFTINNEGYLH